MPRWSPSTPVLAWAALFANVSVILQGAVVRVTHASAGCGQHWPTCNGEIVPLAGGTETLIEFTHRLLSLGVLVLGAWLLARAYRARRERPGLFAFAAAAFALLVVGALLGAATVLLGLSGENAAMGRGVMVATHLVTSVLLVGALAGTVAYATGRGRWPLGLGRQGVLATALGVGLVGMLLLTFSGGIAAMGNTIFPSSDLASGLAADLDPAAHPLIRLRLLHPLIAVTVGVYLFVSLGFAWWLKPTTHARGLTRALTGTYLAQVAVGALNLAFLAPVVLQLLHLSLGVLAFGLLAGTAVVMLSAPAVRRPERAVSPVMENA